MASKPIDAPVQTVTGGVVNRVYDLGLLASEHREISGDAIPYVVIPKDAQVVGLDKMIYHENREFPTRKEASVQVDDKASFVEYFQRFRDDDSLIFARQEEGKVWGALDYHGGPEKKPRWRKHWVTLTVRKTEEWAAWIKQGGVRMSQADFAEFIEDHTPEFLTPDAATMLELATTMKASSEANMENAIRLSNGTVRFGWTESISGKFGSGQTECPESFTARMAVYQGMSAREITCRLRYRISGGKLTLWFDILRALTIERDAFASVAAEIQQATGQTVLMGKV